MTWFRFPEGTEGVTVERQQFGVEARDKDNRAYFRAPDHFARIITSLPGFSISDPPEGTDLADLPRSDPLRDGAISDQARKIQALEDQVENLTTDLSATRAHLAGTLHERDELKLQVHELTVKVQDLEDKNIELAEAAPLMPASKSEKK